MNLLALMGLMISLGASQTQGNIYPECGIVTEIETNTVTIEMCNGNQFQFEGCEDYEKGDLIAVTFYDNGTKSVTDDIILDTKYVGYTDRFQEIELEIVEHEYE